MADTTTQETWICSLCTRPIQGLKATVGGIPQCKVDIISQPQGSKNTQHRVTSLAVACLNCNCFFCAHCLNEKTMVTVSSKSVPLCPSCGSNLYASQVSALFVDAAQRDIPCPDRARTNPTIVWKNTLAAKRHARIAEADATHIFAVVSQFPRWIDVLTFPLKVLSELVGPVAGYIGCLLIAFAALGILSLGAFLVTFFQHKVDLELLYPLAIAVLAFFLFMILRVVHAAPVLLHETLRIKHSNDLIVSYDVRTGTPAWRSQVSGSIQDIADLSPNRIAIATSQMVALVDKVTGHFIWRNEHISRARSLKVCGRNLTIGTMSGELVTLEIENGQAVWDRILEGNLIQVEQSGSNLVALAARGILNCVSIANGEQLWKIIFPERLIHMAVTERRIVLLGENDHLFSLALPSPSLEWVIDLGGLEKRTLPRAGIHLTANGKIVPNTNRGYVACRSGLWCLPWDNPIGLKQVLSRPTFAIDNKGTLLAAATADGVLVILEQNTDQPILAFQQTARTAPTSVSAEGYDMTVAYQDGNVVMYRFEN